MSYVPYYIVFFVFYALALGHQVVTSFCTYVYVDCFVACTALCCNCMGLWSKRQQVKTVTGQNSDTETATEMTIFKTGKCH